MAIVIRQGYGAMRCLISEMMPMMTMVVVVVMMTMVVVVEIFHPFDVMSTIKNGFSDCNIAVA